MENLQEVVGERISGILAGLPLILERIPGPDSMSYRDFHRSADLHRSQTHRFPKSKPGI